MNASDYEFGDFENALLSGRKQRNWLWFGLIVSLTLHLALCTFFYGTRFQSAEAIFVEGKQPPMFKVRNVDLSQVEKNSTADQNSPAAKPNPDQSNQQPDEKRSFDKLMQNVQASAAMPDDMS